MQSGRIAGLGIVGLVNRTPECPTCEVLKSWLDQERAKREYYEQLVLTRSGIVKDTEQIVTSVESFPSIQRVTTLSSLRRQAEMQSRNMRNQSATETSSIARPSELTEAEALFERELNAKETDAIQ